MVSSATARSLEAQAARRFWSPTFPIHAQSRQRGPQQLQRHRRGSAPKRHDADMGKNGYSLGNGVHWLAANGAEQPPVSPA